MLSYLLYPISFNLNKFEKDTSTDKTPTYMQQVLSVYTIGKLNISFEEVQHSSSMNNNKKFRSIQ